MHTSVRDFVALVDASRFRKRYCCSLLQAESACGVSIIDWESSCYNGPINHKVLIFLLQATNVTGQNGWFCFPFRIKLGHVIVVAFLELSLAQADVEFSGILGLHLCFVDNAPCSA